MEKEIQQLIEMGATACQAQAALQKYKDVMEAAEGIFGGEFDHISNEVDVRMTGSTSAKVTTPAKMTTPESNEEDNEGMEDDDDDADDYIDYDSDYETKSGPVKDVDPYAGIFFSKDRREEVIEIEEEPEIVFIPEMNQRVKLMTQGQWMKGCPEPGEQNHLFSLYSQLSEGQCPCPHGCGASVKRKKCDFFAVFSEFEHYIEQLCRIVRKACSACQRKYCIACGEPISVEKIQRPSAAAGDEPLFHCSNLQGVILGIGLSMLEQVYADVLQEPADDQDKTRTAKKRKMDISTWPSLSSTPGDDEDDMYWGAVGHGKGKKAKGGTGYAGDVKEDTSGQVEAQAIQRQKDEKIGQLLSQIRVYLPSLRRQGGGQTSDYLVHPTALAHLRRRFNYICSALLRNDSLTDMSDRSVLYFELFEWLETISNHEALASMMAMPIFIVSSVKSVTAKKTSVRGKPTVREREIVYEGSSGPRELLESISIQAQAALKGLEGAKVPEKAEEELTEEQKRMTNDAKGKAKEASATPADENLKLLKFCRRILDTVNGIDRALRETKGNDFVKRLHESLPKILSSSLESKEIHVQPGATNEALLKAYVDWATRVRFEYCDLSVPTDKDGKAEDDIPQYKFYYNNEARMLANSDIPKRSLAIAKELAVLTTNLPVAWDSSIFLRVDETRVDVIKALITGPEGTPYHNGCYLFDIFLGPSYNQSPPSVKYMTTNGGKFRFNPNLYADGKVCLSLLGTWSGPGWVSGKSTLLQVLISIQSMILCDEPYLNEPGWASSGGTPQSRAYSANVRRMVVKAAMLGNLQNPPEPFAEVIRTHFRLKARSISAQLDQWLAQDDGKFTTSGEYQSPGQKDSASSSSNGFAKDVADMKRAMQQLQENSS